MWKPLETNPNISYMKQMSNNLQRVKKVTKPWAKEYSANQQKELKNVEIALKMIYKLNNSGVFTEDELKEVREKETKRE